MDLKPGHFFRDIENDSTLTIHFYFHGLKNGVIGYIYIYEYIYVYIYIYIYTHVITYIYIRYTHVIKSTKISIKTNVATNKANSRDEM